MKLKRNENTRQFSAFSSFPIENNDSLGPAGGKPNISRVLQHSPRGNIRSVASTWDRRDPSRPLRPTLTFHRAIFPRGLHRTSGATQKARTKINNVVSRDDASRASPPAGCRSHPRAIYANACARNAITHSAITHVTRNRQHLANVDSVCEKRAQAHHIGSPAQKRQRRKRTRLLD